VVLSGCGPKDGLSDYDRKMQGIQDTVEALKSQGAKLEKRHYQLGEAWVVDLNGMEITDDLLKKVRGLGHIAELNLSKSTFGDDHMDLFQSLTLGGVAVKLDFSQTALSDAGFEKLDSPRFLQELNLTGTKVTAAAVERFRAKRRNDQSILPAFKNPKILR